MIVVNGYHRFLLTRAWGSGKHVSADGTQWDTYERNLLAERHIRYGGFGGIAYYPILPSEGNRTRNTLLSCTQRMHRTQGSRVPRNHTIGGPKTALAA